MEDSHISDLKLGKNQAVHAFGVFDGHGGKEVAQFVRAHFSEELNKNTSFNNGDLKTSLTENFLKMDTLLIEPTGKDELRKYAKISKEEDDLQSKKETNRQMDLFKQFMGDKTSETTDVGLLTGCTASVCLIDEANKKLYFANSGDSRSIICKSGVAYPMSIDHKPDLDIEKARIYKAGGWVEEGRINGNLNLSRCLGDLEYKQNKDITPAEQIITANPDVVVENLSSDVEFIILACDGVWDCMTNQEICDFVKAKLKSDPKIKLSKIIEEIFDKIVAPDLGVGKYIFLIFRKWTWM